MQTLNLKTDLDGPAIAIKMDFDGPAIASNRAQRASIGWDRRLNTDNILNIIHHD